MWGNDPSTGALATLIPVVIGLLALGMARLEAWLDRRETGGPGRAERKLSGRV